MFAGEFHARAETRGTFRLPPIFLAAFAPVVEGTSRQVVFLKSLDGSLWLYQAQGWEARLEATRQQLDDQQSRLLMHYVVAESVLAELDVHGRLAIPEALRTYAEISTEVVLVGLYERIELWSPMRWETYLSSLEERHEGVLAKILDLL
jgi:MraZ protein